MKDSSRRADRLNSLLKEVISEVIKNNVKNPYIHELLSVTQVDVTKDLMNATAYISIIATQAEKDSSINALQSAAGFIAVTASKKVTMRYFPQLTFKLDTTAEKQQKIDEILNKINLNNESQINEPT